MTTPRFLPDEAREMVRTWNDGRAFTDYADEHPEMTVWQVAHAVLSQMPDEMVRQFAVQYGINQIDAHRRAQARAVEQAAARQAPPATPPADEARFQAVFDEGRHYVGNHRVRQAYRRWCGDRFDGWHERARANAEAEGNETLEAFTAEWHPGGVGAYYQELRQENIRTWTDWLVKTTAEEVRLETTRELLSSMFALGDGTDVSWGDATIEQHQRRAEMLLRNAVGNTDTAALHTAAVRMITEAGVTCLREVSDTGQDTGRAAA